MDAITAPLEIKVQNDAAGEFEGLASPFGNVDSHGDAVSPGAFAASLAEHKARGSMPIMYAMHGPATGADPWPVGRWHEMEERAAGLFVKGQMLGLDTDRGRFTYSLMKGGALGALSIGYRVPTGGATFPRQLKSGDARRLLNRVHLEEVSLVPIGSNPRARVLSVKADAEVARECAEFKARLAEGDVPTERELERLLRDALGLSRSDAAALVAGRGWKSLRQRDAGQGEGDLVGLKAALGTLAGDLDGFKLPSFK